MTITLTKQYTTRSGLPVKLYDILNNETVTGAYFVSQRNLWIPETWTLSGSYSNEAMFVHDLDLIEVPTPESKPLQEGELVVVWNDFRFDNTNFETYRIRRFVSNTTDNIGYVTSTKYVESSNTFIWDNCVRLSEFKL